jgi:MYXO-CTERM domain-containing protein
LGSGMSSLTTGVDCDCSVAIGKHTYVVANSTVELDVLEASAATGTARVPSAECNVKCASTSLPAAAGGSSAVSAGGGSSSIGAGGTFDGSANSSGNSSGCAVSRAAGGWLPLGVLAALGLLALRRRK